MQQIQNTEQFWHINVLVRRRCKVWFEEGEEIDPVSRDGSGIYIHSSHIFWGLKFVGLAVHRIPPSE